MPRRPRIASGGIAYHVLNRAVGRGTTFHDDADFAAMIRVIEQVHERLPTRLLSYCRMPNHWHLVLFPKQEGELSEFMRLLTVTHTQRCHAHRHTAGTGPLYQGRFKSFPVQRDEHLMTVCRYVERNAVRANFARKAANWRWCSVAARAEAPPPKWLFPLKRWPVDSPDDWSERVDRAETKAELEAIRASVTRGRPFGDNHWTRRTVKALQLESTLIPRGRPSLQQKKTPDPFDFADAIEGELADLELTNSSGKILKQLNLGTRSSKEFATRSIAPHETKRQTERIGTVYGITQEGRYTLTIRRTFNEGSQAHWGNLVIGEATFFVGQASPPTTATKD